MTDKNNFPEPLRREDEIRIVAPASKVEKDYINRTVNFLRELGYTVSLGKHLFSEFNQFAGTDQERLADLQTAFDDSSVKAVFCARGGYGSVRLVDKIDFGNFMKNPKWLAGFSDVTVFHSYLNGKLFIPTIHSPMPVNVDNTCFTNNLNSLDTILQGKYDPIEYDNHALNRLGECEGQLVGGNLSILYSLQATPFALNTANRILFIEDVGEQLYHLDRLLNNFRLSGMLSHLKGLIVGGFTLMQDKKRPFGKTAWEIVQDYTLDYDYPVTYNFPAGHTDNNVPFILGSNIRMNVGINKTRIEFIK